jgi:hypothetical protein
MSPAKADFVPEKWCAVCGRRIERRRKWHRNWDQVTRCSEKCRRSPLNTVDRALEEAILDLLGKRRRGETICPSEAARRLRADDEQAWRELMPRTRNAARRLASSGQVAFTQGGRIVDPSTARGPVRLKLL